MADSDPELEQRHLEAEATIKGFSYTKPSGVGTAKGFVRLGTSPLLKSVVQVIKKSGGENIILSVGGGVSPGMPRANILAMQAALAEFNGARAAR